MMRMEREKRERKRNNGEWRERDRRGSCVRAVCSFGKKGNIYIYT